MLSFMAYYLLRLLFTVLLVTLLVLLVSLHGKVRGTPGSTMSVPALMPGNPHLQLRWLTELLNARLMSFTFMLMRIISSKLALAAKNNPCMSGFSA